MRYIDADKLKKNLTIPSASIIEIGETIIAQIDDQPTADVVEVVRCKDCKYGKKDSLFVGGYECSIFDNSNVEADDFCSYGERAEE